ncbi:amidohydrolase family protein [Streptomyces sp. DT171]|uniref:amidohydrolase family protein n=1 Tax=Streptomyces sp. DT171 TaxID=3416524 RepID=UPI003CF287D6
MLLIHAADAVLGAPDAPEGSDAVAVSGGAVVAVGPYAELAAAHPSARVRRWPGLITPGLLNVRAGALLEAAYHPDPREADILGTAPLTGDALAALTMDDTRWGAGARRGVQRMLSHGTTAVAATFTRPAVRTAVARAGLRVHAPRTPPHGAAAAPVASDLDPFAAVREWRDAFAGPLTVGGPADLAVFAVRGGAGAGAGSRCVATVLGGRLVYRSS